MKVRKLLVDAHTFDEGHQGIRSFLKGIYSELDYTPNELEVYLAAHDIENLKQEFSYQKDFKYIKLKHTNKYVRLAYELPNIIWKNKFDFAHFNYYLPLFLTSRCQYIVTIHDLLFIDFPSFFPIKYRLKNTFMFKRSATKAHILNTVSEYSEERIKFHFNINEKRITVVPNAVDSTYYNHVDKESSKKYIKATYCIENFIVYVSRIEPRKNHKLLIESYIELELWKQNISLVLIGKESFKSPLLEQLINKAKLVSNQKVVLLDSIGNEELISFYNTARLAVFPSLCEGFGIPPLESGVLQTPTLCSDVTAMKDFTFFKDTHTFNPNNKQEFKTKLSALLNQIETSENKQELKRISEEIKKKYDWKKSAAIFKRSILENSL